jgi:hypothetical protein
MPHRKDYKNQLKMYRGLQKLINSCRDVSLSYNSLVLILHFTLLLDLKAFCKPYIYNCDEVY